MKKFLVYLMCFLLFPVIVQAASVSASIDDNCKLISSNFTIPAGGTATKLSVSLSSSWLPCDGPSTPHRIGARIQGPMNNTLYYGVKYYNNKTKVLAGNLAGLTLGPGTYTFDAPDGGKLTRAILTYTLNKKPPPKPKKPGAKTTNNKAGWGTISGEWSDPEVGSKAKIIQNGKSMTIINSFMWEGKEVIWSGTGTVIGNKIVFKYTYIKNQPELWENGTMTFTRVAKNKLTGKWLTVTGKYSKPITFLLMKSDDETKTKD
jgi:hypothetical protein